MRLCHLSHGKYNWATRSSENVKVFIRFTIHRFFFPSALGLVTAYLSMGAVFFVLFVMQRSLIFTFSTCFVKNKNELFHFENNYTTNKMLLKFRSFQFNSIFIGRNFAMNARISLLWKFLNIFSKRNSFSILCHLYFWASCFFFLSLFTNLPFVSICFLHSLRMCSNFAFFPFITQKQKCSQWLDMFFYVMCACIRFKKKKANFHNMVVRFWICVSGMCSIVCPISSKVHNHHKMTKLSRNMEQSARMAWTSIVTKRKH